VLVAQWKGCVTINAIGKSRAADEWHRIAGIAAGRGIIGETIGVAEMAVLIRHAKAGFELSVGNVHQRGTRNLRDVRAVDGACGEQYRCCQDEATLGHAIPVGICGEGAGLSSRPARDPCDHRADRNTKNGCFA
jgi:hypothetical protein